MPNAKTTAFALWSLPNKAPINNQSHPYAALSNSVKLQSHNGIVKIHPLSGGSPVLKRLYYIVAQRDLRSWVLDRALHWVAIAAIVGVRAI